MVKDDHLRSQQPNPIASIKSTITQPKG